MPKTYYVGNMPVSDELYHYGRKGMKWGKNIFEQAIGAVGGAARNVGNFASNTYNSASRGVTKAANSAARAVGGAARNVGNYASNAARSAGNAVRRAGDSVGDYARDTGRRIGERAREAGEYVTGNAHRQQLNAANANAFEARKNERLAKLYSNAATSNAKRGNGQKYEEYKNKAFDASSKATRLDSDIRRAQAAYENTLPGQLEKVGRNVENTASKAGKAVSNAASNAGKTVSNAAKDVGSWGSKQVDKGKQLLGNLFGGKKKQKTMPKPSSGGKLPSIGSIASKDNRKKG